jgi:hypothetical protein
MMAKNNDPLIDSLMQMAVAVAPLIRKARESGIFRDRDTVVDAEIVTPEAPKPPEPPKAADPPPVSPDTSALQDIVVRQALRINELEAEVAALKAKAAKPASKKAGPKAKPKVRPAKA